MELADATRPGTPGPETVCQSVAPPTTIPGRRRRSLRSYAAAEGSALVAPTTPVGGARAERTRPRQAGMGLLMFDTRTSYRRHVRADASSVAARALRRLAHLDQIDSALRLAAIRRYGLVDRPRPGSSRSAATIRPQGSVGGRRPERFERTKDGPLDTPYRAPSRRLPPCL